MWVNDFVEYLRCEKNRSEKTIEAYSGDLEEFRSFMKSQDETLSWQTVDKDLVRDWMVDMMEKGSSPRSVNRRLSALKSFYKFLLRRELISRDPVHSLQGPKGGKPLPKFVRESEMDKLLDGNYFPDTLEGMRDRLILLTFYSTGVRLAELIGLDWDDVSLIDRQIKVTGKRNKQRIIPLGEEMCRELQAYRERLMAEISVKDTDAVFVKLPTGVRISRAKVTSLVKYYLSNVTTVGKKSPHTLRHTFATSMLNHEADLQSVKELLGHESLATTEIYTHTTFEELKKIYNQAHPRA